MDILTQSSYKKYTVKYTKRLNLESKLALTIFPFALHFGTYNLSKIGFNISPILPLSMYIPFIGMWGHHYYKSEKSFSFPKRISAQLYKVIELNELFKKDTDALLINVYSSLKFIFYFTENNTLIIEAYAYGAKYTNKLDMLTTNLQSALNLPLLDINHNKPAFTQYEFSIKETDALSIHSTLDLVNYNDRMMLDTEKVWNHVITPHALIAGSTGSGKTYFLYYLIMQFAKLKADVYILDPKRSDLNTLIHFLPEGHEKVAMTPNQICAVLRKVTEEMNLRYEKYFSTSLKMGLNYTHFNLKPIVVVFDELAAFMAEDPKAAKEGEKYLKQICYKGRQAGITIILSTQKPDHEAIPTAIRDQVGLHVALGKMSTDGYKMTLGVGAKDLPPAETGIGKGYIMIDGLGWTTPRAFKTPNLNDLDIHTAVEQFYK